MACPYFKDGACGLEPEMTVDEQLKVFYCDSKMRPEAYEDCPTYKKEKES